MSGWIKIHRSILDWEWYTDTNTKVLFLHILLRANHAPQKWQGITIGRGQVLTGRHKLSIETGLSEQQIRTALDKLSSTNEITIESTNKNSLINIVNYDSYQMVDDDSVECNQQDNQQSTCRITNRQPATNQRDNQQVTTNKNVKNIKNEEECKEVKECVYAPDEIFNDHSLETPLKKEKKVAPKKEKAEPPAIEEFVEYGLGIVPGLTQSNSEGWKITLVSKFKAWSESGWKDGYGKPIRNWKTKIQNTLPYLKPLGNGSTSKANGLANLKNLAGQVMVAIESGYVPGRTEQ